MRRPTLAPVVATITPAEPRKSLPWYRWFPGDYMRSTRGWSLLEHGLYRVLLDAAWDLNGLPDDEEEIRRLSAATPAEWTSAWRRVASKFPLTPDGRRRNPRQEQERANSARVQAERSKAATISWEKRRGK